MCIISGVLLGLMDSMVSDEAMGLGLHILGDDEPFPRPDLFYTCSH
jgi:hypothetical protein